MKKIIFIFLLTLAFSALVFSAYSQHEGHQPEGNGLASSSQSNQMKAAAKEEVKAKVKKPASGKEVYYCPMHPSYTSDKPGDCPICNMKLVKKEKAQALEKETAVTQAPEQGFYVSMEKQQLIGVKTDKVIYRPLNKVIRTVGRVAFDPELYKAQQEYIEAINTFERLSESGQEEVIKRSEALVEAAKLKLRLQGLDTKQIEELQESRENDQSLLISSSESDSAWVYATIYEYEVESVKIGQEVTISSISAPGKEFKGKIVAQDPVFDEMTRSVRARIKVDNPDALLKPNMYVDVKMEMDLGVQLALPKEAIMDTGIRNLVFVALPEGYFQSREIKTGVSSDNYVQVIEGVNEGEDVVISGNFLIDSESKLKAALEGTSHEHGQ